MTVNLDSLIDDWFCLTHSKKDLVPQMLSEQQKTTNANGARRKTIAGASRLCAM
jgi:hypothetical protein